jgi:hypothetical protein
MNIRETIKSISVDKAFHFIAGWALVATLFPYFPLFSLAALVFFAALKEWDDAHGHGTPDIWDFLVTVIGGIGAVVVHVVLRLF